MVHAQLRQEFSSNMNCPAGDIDQPLKALSKLD